MIHYRSHSADHGSSRSSYSHSRPHSAFSYSYSRHENQLHQKNGHDNNNYNYNYNNNNNNNNNQEKNEFEGLIVIKKTSSGRLAKIHIREHPPERPSSPSRHDTIRTCTGLKTYPKPLPSKKKFKIGMISPVQRRCDSPIRSRIMEIYRNFTPSPKNYKAVNPRWKG